MRALPQLLGDIGVDFTAARVFPNRGLLRRRPHQARLVVFWFLEPAAWIAPDSTWTSFTADLEGATGHATFPGHRWARPCLTDP